MFVHNLCRERSPAVIHGVSKVNSLSDICLSRDVADGIETPAIFIQAFNMCYEFMIKMTDWG